MTQERALQLLQQGINAHKAGQTDQARQMFQQAIKLDPRNEMIWMWLASIARDDKERLFCLKQILAINPNNEKAQQGLKRLGVNPAQPAAEAKPGIPRIPPDRLPTIQGEVDKILKSYSARPQTVVEFEWVRKTRRRYGEAAAIARQRRKMLVQYGSTLIAGLVIVAIFALILVNLLAEEEAVDQSPRFLIYTPTPTATFTATPEIVANTPIPEDLANTTPVPVSEITGNLPQGFREIIPTSTPFHPTPSNLRDNQRGISMAGANGIAVAFYAGNYDRVINESQLFRNDELLGNVCEPEAYYYPAISYALRGGPGNLRDALELLEEVPEDPQRPNRDNRKCEESELIEAARCFVNYQYGLDNPEEREEAFDEALDACRDSIRYSLNANPPRVPLTIAVDTQARIQLARERYTDAASTLDEVLENDAFIARSEEAAFPSWAGPANTRLLLLRADVALERGQPGRALEYLDRVLYIAPNSEEGLKKRSEAILRLADNNNSNPELQILQYGAAAVAAERYLLSYGANADGYILLAEARLREGNITRAFDTVNQVLVANEIACESGNNNCPRFPENDLTEAYKIRLQIYQNRQAWELAYNDLVELTRLEPDNLRWEYERLQLAFEKPDLELMASDEIFTAIDDLLGDDSTREAQLIAAVGDLDPYPVLTLELKQAQLLSQTCLYDTAISCDPEQVLGNLDETFLTELETREDITDEEKASLTAQVRAYRAEALYQQTEEAEDPEADELTREEIQSYETILEDELLPALEYTPSAEEYYLLGRLLQKLERYTEARQAYEWVIYWSNLYDYPFAAEVEVAQENIIEILEEEES